MALALAVVLAVSIGSVGTQAGNEIELSVSPRISPAPSTVRIMVFIQSDAKNRELILETDSGAFYTSSTVQLEGDDSRRSYPFTFVELPPGSYEVLARVVRSDGQERRAAVNYVITP